jgi:Domain of unknown function (DUF4190)
LNNMTIQGGNFGEEAHDEAKQPPQGPPARPFGQDFIPPAYAGQPPAQPEPNAPRYPPQPGPVPPWDPPPTDYPLPSQPPPSGYGPPGYPDPPPYGGPSYPSPPPQYGQPYPPPGYGGGGYGGPPVYPGPYDPYHPYQSRSHETNGLAIGSLATSIAGVVLGIPLSLFCWLGILIPIVGAVLGAVALNQIKRTGQPGRGLAIAGIAVGATAAVLLVILVIAVMAAFTSPSLR